MKFPIVYNVASGLTCMCGGDTGMSCRKVEAYVAFALIGAVLLCSNGRCNGDESNEDELPREMHD